MRVVMETSRVEVNDEGRVVGSSHPGDVVELDDVLAEVLIERGSARPADPPKGGTAAQQRAKRTVGDARERRSGHPQQGLEG